MESQSPKEEGESEAQRAAEKPVPQWNYIPATEPPESKATTQPAGNKPKTRCWGDKRWKHPQVIVNGALAFIAVCAAIIYFCQLQQMKRQLALDQRAWVNVTACILDKAPVIGEKISVTATLLNSGRTPALNVHMAGRVFTQEDISLKDMVDNSAGTKEKSHTVIGPTATGFISPDSEVTVSRKEQIDTIENETNQLFTIGFIYYTDIFGANHRTIFCYCLTGKQGIEKRNMQACAIGNTAD